MVRLIGILCYFGYVTTSKTRMQEDDLIRNGWIFSNKEVIRKDFSHSGFGRSHSPHACHPRSLWEEPKLIQHAGQCRGSIQTERVLLPRPLLPLCAPVLQSGLIARGKDAKEGRQKVFFTTLDPINDEPEEEYQDLSKKKKRW